MNWVFQQYVYRTERLSSLFAYESETFHRQQPNGISHSENGEQKPQNLPFPSMTWTPSNTAMPRPTACTTPNCSSDGRGTVAHVCCKVPTGYNGAPQIRPTVASTQIKQFWLFLAEMLLREYAIKWWFVIPTLLNNVSVLPGETWTLEIVSFPG